MCDCIKQLNDPTGDLVKNHHTMIDHTMPLRGGFPKAVIRTIITADAPRKTKPINLVASFCPFCGEEYPK